MSREKDDNIKINIPLFTNLELEEFDFKLDNYLDSIVQEVSKAVLHDKENILLQKVVQKLEKELEQEKEKNKELLYKLEVEKIDNKYNKEEAQEEMLSKYKIRAKIQYLEKLEFGNDLVSQWLANSTTINILKELLEE